MTAKRDAKQALGRERVSGATSLMRPGRDAAAPLSPRITGLCTVLIAASVFGLYLGTMAPSIVWAFSGSDSGDLAAAVATWGVPHPTGYPLYVLLGGLVTHLVPVGQIAFRLNLLSALCTVAASALVFLTVLRLSATFEDLPASVRYIAAAMAALVLATTRTVWSQSIITEVYALELLFAAAIAWLLADRKMNHGNLYLLAFVGGLALTHHLTIVFSLVGAILAVISRYRRHLLNARLLATIAVLFVLPLCLYLLLPWRASQHPASNWGDPSTPDRFFDVVTGAPYHYLVDYSIPHALRAVPAVVRLAFQQFAWWVIPLAVLGVATLVESHAPYAIYLAVVTLLSAAFLSAYQAEGREAYLLQGYVMISIGAGIGLLSAARLLAGVLGPKRRQRAPWVVLAAAIFTVGPWLLVGLGEFNLRHDWAAWNYARGGLLSLPAGATITTRSDQQTFPLWYAQRAEHLRQDVHVVDIRFRDPAHTR